MWTPVWMPSLRSHRLAATEQECARQEEQLHGYSFCRPAVSTHMQRLSKPGYSL